MSQSTSIIAKRHDDCLACRMISGTGLLGISVYLYSHIKRQQSKFSRSSLLILTTGTAGLGVARLLNVYPFKDKTSSSTS